LDDATTVTFSIRTMCDADAEDVLRIFHLGRETLQATFETADPSWAAFSGGKLPGHRFVAVRDSVGDRSAAGREQDGAVLGWIMVSPTSTRPVYAGVVEVSVYVDPAAWGNGIGAALLRRLIESTEADDVWTLQAGIFPENTASLRLHRRAGFRVVGVRERLGRHNGCWRDVVLLERRSPVVG
jgi:phosphinothricin acetyltransferase